MEPNMSDSHSGQRRVRPQAPAGLARALGWLSIALGLPQVAAPAWINRCIGVRDSDGARLLMRAVGVRELGAGFALLSRPRSAGWLWARVAGDLMDLALLATALRDDRNERDKVSPAAAAVAAITVLDLFAAVRRTRASERTAEGGGIRAKATVT
jgi:hypothetical protein